MPTDPPSLKRRRFRPVLTLTLALVVMFVAWVGVEVYFAYTANPAIKVNYAEKLHKLAEDWQDRSESNAWPSLVHAIETHKTILGELPNENGVGWYDLPYRYTIVTDYDWAHQMASDEYHRTGRDWNELLTELDTAKAWAFKSLNAFGDRGIWDDMDRLSKARHVIMPAEALDNEYSISGPVSPLYSDARELARAFRAGMQWASSRGDWNRYIISMEHCLALSRVLMMQPSMLSWLTGTAIRELAISKLTTDLVMGHIPLPVVETVREAYLRQAELPPMRYTMEADRYINLDMVQRMFTSSGRFIPTQYKPLTGSGEQLHWTNNLISFARPRWATIEQRMNQLYDERIELIEMPRWQRLANPAYRTSTMTEWMTDRASLEGHISNAASVWMYGTVKDRDLAKDQGVSLLLAIEHYAAENGSYPERLMQLVPEYIPKVPDDPFAMQSVAWQYRLVQNAPRGARPYILYSVGIDGIDNGGTIPDGMTPDSALQEDFITGDVPTMDYVVTAMNQQN